MSDNCELLHTQYPNIDFIQINGKIVGAIKDGVNLDLKDFDDFLKELMTEKLHALKDRRNLKLKDEIKEHLLTKFSSGRWIATVFLVFTYCLSFIGIIILTGLKILSPDFLMGYLTGLGTLVLKIVTDYFERQDRKTENGGQK